MCRFTLTTMLMAVCLAIEARQSICLNFGWRFVRTDVPGAAATHFDDSRWQLVDLPHDAAVAHAFQQQGDGANARVGFLPQRQGWYRRHISYDSLWSGKRVVLEFEGVYRNARVYVNGIDCGVSQPNGYLDFQVDITPYLNHGDNVIAVAYDNSYTKSSRWYNGEGICRDVWLHVLHPLHVAQYGTWITTPTVTRDRALVAVTTEVSNHLSDSVLCRLVTELHDPQGRVVDSREAVAPFAAGETYSFQQQFAVDHPQLWHVGRGVLYRAVSRVYHLGRYPSAHHAPKPVAEATDVYHTTFGIRHIELSPDSGLILNGQRVYVNGVCLHTDLGPLGTASFADAWDQRLNAITQQLGCNGIRLSHNAYPRYVLQWADEHGVLVVDEFFDKWEDSFYGPKAKMGQLHLRDITTQMRRDRNHPSVFMWSVGNEVYQQIQADKTRHGGVDMLKMLVAHAKGVDQTRPVTCSQYPNRYGDKRRKKNEAEFLAADPHQFEFYTDVVSTNYLEQFWDADHKRYPQLIFMAGELAVGDLGYDYFNYDHSYPIGHFYWGGTDYIGESMGWPAKGWTRGLIDFTNRVKPLGHSVRSFYWPEPMVQIVTRPAADQGSIVWNDLKISFMPLEQHWNYRSGDTIEVQVMTNCPETELLLGDRSLGRKPLPPAGTPPQVVWRVPYMPGELRAVGYRHGQPIAYDTLRTAGRPVRLAVQVSADTISADGMSLAYLNYTVLDANGNVCPVDDITISFDVTGSGTLAGTASSNMLTSEPWHTSQRTVCQGRAQLIVRSARKPGTITVKANAKGMRNEAKLKVIGVPKRVNNQ